MCVLKAECVYHTTVTPRQQCKQNNIDYENSWQFPKYRQIYQSTEKEITVYSCRYFNLVSEAVQSKTSRKSEKRQHAMNISKIHHDTAIQ